MALRSLTHKVLNECDVNHLLRHFSVAQLAFVFSVPEEYIYKTRNLQRIQAEENFQKNIYNDSDEMKLGRVGSWTLSKERISINEIKNQQNEG